MTDFLTHPHHRHTQSFDWLIQAFGRPVRTLYGDPKTLGEYLPSLPNNPPRLLILFQLEHLAAWASCFCPVLVFPMHDLTRLTPDSYLASLRDVEWISFSRTLHQRLAGLGLASQYLQYAPNPADYPEVSWQDGPKGYFWERMPGELDARAVGGLLASLGVDSLEVRRLGDGQFTSADLREREQAERSWQGREAYLQSLRRFNVYAAPRRHEGIGMTFLEAMAMGMCVVAENQPTASEYILSGHNGILYGGDEDRLYAPRKVGPADLQRMGRKARESLGRIHRAWLEGRGRIGETVERMLKRDVSQRAPPAGGLSATLGFWQNRKMFWKIFCEDSAGPWRSVVLENQSRSENSLLGRLRGFWRHPRAFLLKALSR